MPDRRDGDLAGLTRAVIGITLGGSREATRLATGGARLWWRQMQWAERTALRAFSERLALATPPPEPRAIAEVSASDALAELLGRAVEQSAGEGREELFRRIVGALVPDEARIIATLGDGQRAALVHVDARVPGGARLLENATLLGGRASLSVPDMAGAYVSKLLAVGLLEVGAEDPALANDYEILLADRAVRDALAQGAISRVPGRAIRRSLRLSTLGTELWAACRP